MPQFFVSPSDIQGQEFSIRGPEAHHLIHVLRKKINDSIRIFDGAGHAYQGILSQINENELQVSGRIVETVSDPDQKKIRLCLYQGLPRGAKFDYVIEKATELGVDEIHPFLSDKNLVRLTEAQAKSKMMRWKKLAHAAAKQSGRADLPKVEAPVLLKDLSEAFRSNTTILFTTHPTSKNFKNVLKEHPLERGNFNFIIGPESGFTPKEEEWLVKQGALLASFGKNILRTETAGLAALSILNYEFESF